MLKLVGSPSPSLPSTGDTFDGKYRVEREIGRGGMGAVFEAEHLRLERRVALKLLHPDVLEDSNAVERFLREARAAARLSSAHVVRVYDVDITPEGVPYIVMELLDGRDAAAELSAPGLIPLKAVVQILRHAAIAMREAHALGIIHRDLKPSNLFLCRVDGDFVVKVLDFGISKITNEAQNALTMPHVVVGTTHFMSPEQLRGTTDARTDIWALGVIAYQLLTGVLPFRGSATAVIASIFTDVAPPLVGYRPDTPAALVTIVERALEKEPARRFQSVGAFAEALDRVATELQQGGGQEKRREDVPAEDGADGLTVESAKPAKPAKRALYDVPRAGLPRRGSIDPAGTEAPWERGKAARATGKSTAIGVCAAALLVVVSCAVLATRGTPAGAKGSPRPAAQAAGSHEVGLVASTSPNVQILGSPTPLASSVSATSMTTAATGSASAPAPWSMPVPQAPRSSKAKAAPSAPTLYIP